jgi:hypothetical protein
MSEVKDILLDDDGDLLIKDGDLVFGASDQQHINDLLICLPGHIREFPLAGIGIQKYIGAPFTLEIINALQKRIQLQLELDGYKVNSIIINSFTDITIDAERI